ncbi:MAG: hypothetical protein WCK02_07030 [Bacteroidota bacterium]
MDNRRVVELINNIFNRINIAKSIEDIIKIEEEHLLKRIDTESYPKIDFRIAKEDIDKLIADNLINCLDFKLKLDVQSKIDDPLTRLLYALAWKNGDLHKIKHIIKGIYEIHNNNELPDEAIVFYQFGRYLTRTKSQPIIDQHVIRAFAVYNSIKSNNNEIEIENFRKLDTLDKRNKETIKEYINWINSLCPELMNDPDYTYHIDKLLFFLGKTIKLKKTIKQLI